MSLREDAIRLAYNNPTLRPKILELVAKMDAKGSASNGGEDPGQIGEKKSGPLKKESDEPYMSSFNQEEHGELTKKQESGSLAKPDKAAAEAAEDKRLRAEVIRLAAAKPEFRRQLLDTLQG